MLSRLTSNSRAVVSLRVTPSVSWGDCRLQAEVEVTSGQYPQESFCCDRLHTKSESLPSSVHTQDVLPDSGPSPLGLLLCCVALLQSGTHSFNRAYPELRYESHPQQAARHSKCAPENSTWVVHHPQKATELLIVPSPPLCPPAVSHPFKQQI